MSRNDEEGHSEESGIVLLLWSGEGTFDSGKDTKRPVLMSGPSACCCHYIRSRRGLWGVKEKCPFSSSDQTDFSGFPTIPFCLFNDGPLLVVCVVH